MNWQFPLPMTIRCYQCGKVIDVMIPDKESREYPCPACGKNELFDLGAWKRLAMAHTEKMTKKIQGGL